MDAVRCTVVFHPLVVAGCALVGAGAFAGFIVCVLDEPHRSLQLYYAVPIGVPFVFFLFDRAALCCDENRRLPRAVWIVDALAVVLALARLVTLALPYSGHALFLVYALGTVRSWPARAAALAVGVQVIHFKLAILPDAALWPGLMFGVLLVFVRVWQIKRRLDS